MRTADGEVVGSADYIIENGWSKFARLVVAEQHRNQQTINTFIQDVYQLLSELKQTFWWSAVPQMEPYFDAISAARPDMTFAAGGAINRIVHATE